MCDTDGTKDWDTDGSHVWPDVISSKLDSAVDVGNNIDAIYVKIYIGDEEDTMDGNDA